MTMNCTGFQEALAADPGGHGGALRAHAARCPRCARQLERSRHGEAALRAALDVEVPDTLAARVLVACPDADTPADPGCLEFRRRLGAEPGAVSPALQRHERECAACRAHAVSLRRDASRLARALAVEPPEGLEARILMRQAFGGDPAPARRPRRVWYAMAAGVLLLVSGVLGWRLADPLASLERAVIAHIEDEPQSMVSSHRLDPRLVSQVLEEVGIELTDEVGKITYATICPIRDRRGAHLVVAGDSALVTVLVMPQVSLARRHAIARSDVRGVLVPVRGGSMAIVGPPGEPLEAIEMKMRSGLRWRL